MQAEKDKTVIKSLRISSSLEERLEAFSKRRNMTESAYLSGALHRQVLLEPITPAFEGITIESNTFRSIVCLAKRESIELLGAEVAKRDLLFALELFDLPQIKDSLLVFLREIAADSWHWFKIGMNPRADRRILLYHNFGMNWSLFLSAFLVEAFALLSEAPPGLTVTERLLRVEWTEEGLRRKTTSGPSTAAQRDFLVVRRD